MIKSRETLLAAKAAALAAKAEFESKYLRDLLDCAVGLGLNSAQDHWVMKVYAQSADVGSRLPHHFGTYEVDVEVTGAVSAY